MTDTRYIEDLRRRYNTGAKLKFVNFWGHQPGKHGVTASCFSQWYGAPFEIEGQRYPTAEHYMMAEKARLFGDEATRALVFKAPNPGAAKAPNPGAAKALGRQVIGFNDETWLANRYAIVVRANEAKFGQNPELRDFLLQTGNRVLVEASPVDRIWGVGMAQDDEHIANPNLWRGLNLLGFALMQVRDTLRA